MSREYPVGIIGGGIGGLTCAYYLARAGIPSVVIEREQRLGGRLRAMKDGARTLDLGAKAFSRSCTELLRLIGHLELGAYLIPLVDAHRVGLRTPAGVISFTEKEVEVGNRLSPRERACAVWYLLNHARTQTLPQEDSPPNRLHAISWADDIRHVCGERTLEVLFRPLAWAMAFTPPEELSALAVRLLLQLFLAPFQRLRGGFGTLITRLSAATQPYATLLTETEVIAVATQGSEFVLTVRTPKGASTLRVEQLVCAMPLPRASRLLHGAGLRDWRSPFAYREVYQTFVRGTPHPDMAANHYSLVISEALPHGALALRVDDETLALVSPSAVSLEALLSTFCLPGAQVVSVPAEWSAALQFVPVVPPGAPMPGPRTTVPNLYLCGDYYYMLGLESSILTAREAASMATQAIRTTVVRGGSS